MQKETISTLAQLVVRSALKAATKDVEALTISEMLGDELPGLDADVHESIYNKALEFLNIAEIHIDIPIWRLEENQREAEFDAQPMEPGSVW